MTFDLESTEGQAVVGQIARGVVNKSAVDNPGIQAQQGTVISYADPTEGALSTLTVRFDGDPTGTVQEVQNISGQQLTEGDRVFCMFVPPHAAVALGRVVSQPESKEQRWSMPGTLSDTTSPPYAFPSLGKVHAVRVLLGTAGSSSTSVDVNRNGSSQVTVTLAAGETDSGMMCIDEPFDTPDLLTFGLTAGTDAADLAILAYVCWSFTCSSQCDDVEAGGGGE